jgi:hypothetical protein
MAFDIQEALRNHNAGASSSLAGNLLMSILASCSLSFDIAVESKDVAKQASID